VADRTPINPSPQEPVVQNLSVNQPKTPLVAEPKPAPPQQPERPATPRAEEMYGTKVKFVNNPLTAGRKAAQDEKLLFVLHISGNFEDAGFT
jgi:hypothetical protein